LVFAGSGSGQSVLIWTDPEYRESKETVLCWGGNKWPRRPLGVNYSAEACSHCVLGGSSVEE